MLSTVGIAWKHPGGVKRLKESGDEKGAAEQQRLSALKTQYEARDLRQASQSELQAILVQELGWLDAHQANYYDLEVEFAIHQIPIVSVGQELNKRGGMQLVRSVGSALGSSRRLDTSWAGIGDWRG